MTATDGAIGHAEALFFDAQSWATHWIAGIDWASNNVNVGPTREQVRHSPAYDDTCHAVSARRSWTCRAMQARMSWSRFTLHFVDPEQTIRSTHRSSASASMCRAFGVGTGGHVRSGTGPGNRTDRGGGITAPVCEFELRLKSGSATDHLCDGGHACRAAWALAQYRVEVRTWRTVAARSSVRAGTEGRHPNRSTPMQAKRPSRVHGMRTAQDSLGVWSDDRICLTAIRSDAEFDMGARSALKWLEDRLGDDARRAARSLRKAMKRPVFWRRAAGASQPSSVNWRFGWEAAGRIPS